MKYRYIWAMLCNVVSEHRSETSRVCYASMLRDRFDNADMNETKYRWLRQHYTGAYCEGYDASARWRTTGVQELQSMLMVRDKCWKLIRDV